MTLGSLFGMSANSQPGTHLRSTNLPRLSSLSRSILNDSLSNQQSGVSTNLPGMVNQENSNSSNGSALHTSVSSSSSSTDNERHPRLAPENEQRSALDDIRRNYSTSAFLGNSMFAPRNEASNYYSIFEENPVLNQRAQNLDNSRARVLQEIQHLINLENNDPSGERRDVVINISPETNMFPHEPSLGHLHGNLMRNMLNMMNMVGSGLINVNGGIAGLGGNFREFLEPVRVTVSDDEMKMFLVTFTYKKECEENQNVAIKDQHTCPICQDKFEEEQVTSYIKSCQHMFHNECLQRWLKDFSHKCPVCRLSVDPEKNKNN